MAATATRTIVRVLPSQGNWEVRCEKVSSTHHQRKDDAISYGRSVAHIYRPSQLVVHRADGTIEIEYTYDNDPYPPPG